MVEVITSLTPEHLEIGPHFPVDLSPGYSVGLPDEGDELLEVPRSVHHMLGSNLSVIIDVGFALRAVKDLALAHGEQLVAEGTLIKVVTLFLE